MIKNKINIWCYLFESCEVKFILFLLWLFKCVKFSTCLGGLHTEDSCISENVQTKIFLNPYYLPIGNKQYKNMLLVF